MGRKKQYNEEEVLESAMVTFWENGYKQTSVRTLEESMGINQFSIYASFKNKKTLFKKALQRYENHISNRFLTDLKSENCTINDIESFLVKFGKEIISGTIPNSCLMVNTASELSPEDKDILQSVIMFFEGMRRLFKKALENSLKHQLVKPKLNINQSAEYLVGIAQSISIYAKIKSEKQVRDYIHFAIQQIRD